MPYQPQLGGWKRAARDPGAQSARTRQRRQQQQSRQQRPGPIAGPGPEATGESGDYFNVRGPGRYYNPQNSNDQQFNRPAVKGMLHNVVEAHTRAQYFRRAGMGQAIRYTLGMGPTPSHVNDYINARMNPSNSTGLHPGSVYIHPHQQSDWGFG